MTSTQINNVPFGATGTTSAETPKFDNIASPNSYTYTPSTNQIIDLTTCSANTDFDTKIAVYLTSDINAGGRIAYNDDDDAGSAGCSHSNLHSTLTNVPLNAGVSYTILVGGYGNYVGTYDLLVVVAGTTIISTRPFSATGTVTSDAEQGTTFPYYANTYFLRPNLDKYLKLTLCTPTTNFDAAIQVLKEELDGTYTSIAAADVDPNCTVGFGDFSATINTVLVQANTNYKVLVGSYNSSLPESNLSYELLVTDNEPGYEITPLTDDQQLADLITDTETIIDSIVTGFPSFFAINVGEGSFFSRVRYIGLCRLVHWSDKIKPR